MNTVYQSAFLRERAKLCAEGGSLAEEAAKALTEIDLAEAKERNRVAREKKEVELVIRKTGARFYDIQRASHGWLLTSKVAGIPGLWMECGEDTWRQKVQDWAKQEGHSAYKNKRVRKYVKSLVKCTPYIEHVAPNVFQFYPRGLECYGDCGWSESWECPCSLCPKPGSGFVLNFDESNWRETIRAHLRPSLCSTASPSPVASVDTPPPGTPSGA